jgi:hypothetical protein
MQSDESRISHCTLKIDLIQLPFRGKFKEHNFKPFYIFTVNRFFNGGMPCGLDVFLGSKPGNLRG